MQKMVLRTGRFIAAIVCIMFSVSAAAANIFGFGTNSTAVPAAASSNQTASSNQFINNVNTLYQQSQNEMAAQLSQQVKQAQAQSQTPNNTATTTTTTSNSSTPSMSAPVAAPVNTTSMPVAPAQNYSAPVPSAAPAAPTSYGTQAPQNQVYTGFGTGNSNSAPSNSGGWNIKY